jgi:phosphinothricin acetyltransferase
MTMTDIQFAPLSDEMLPEACRIYNHYVENSTATFHTNPLTCEQFASVVGRSESQSRQSWMILDKRDALLGYCSLGPYHSREAYRYTGVVAVYLDPQHTRRGLGARAVGFVEQQARGHDLHTLIALISGENTPSLSLFAKLGYQPAGRLIEAGYKFGRYLDMVSLQKILPGGPAAKETSA